MSHGSRHRELYLCQRCGKRKGLTTFPIHDIRRCNPCVKRHGYAGEVEPPTPFHRLPKRERMKDPDVRRFHVELAKRRAG